MAKSSPVFAGNFLKIKNYGNPFSSLVAKNALTQFETRINLKTCILHEFSIRSSE